MKQLGGGGDSVYSNSGLLAMEMVEQRELGRELELPFLEEADGTCEESH